METLNTNHVLLTGDFNVGHTEELEGNRNMPVLRVCGMVDRWFDDLAGSTCPILHRAWWSSEKR